MKERPILFSGPMVRAILDGRKTQTRRVMQLQPHPGSNVGLHDVLEYKGCPVATWPGESEFDWFDCHCPYGKPGDRLYVKEPFWCVHENDDGIFFDLKYEDETIIKPPFEAASEWERTNAKRANWNTFRKHQARFMPRWASRLTLEITDVRVERLQDISEKDAKAEGVEPARDIWDPANPDTRPFDSYRMGFADLWDAINKKHPWGDDPWVWVLGFRVVEPEPTTTSVPAANQNATGEPK